MTALTHGPDKPPHGKTADAMDTRFPGAPGLEDDSGLLVMLEADNQRLFELAELMADYDRKQWEWLEPVLRRQAETDAETLALLESVDNPYDPPET